MADLPGETWVVIWGYHLIIRRPRNSTDVFKVNKDFGDGIGCGKRRDTNEPFEFTSMELTYQIVNSYSVAFLCYFLKGQKEYWTFLAENHWPDAMLWDVKGMADH